MNTAGIFTWVIASALLLRVRRDLGRSRWRRQATRQVVCAATSIVLVLAATGCPTPAQAQQLSETQLEAVANRLRAAYPDHIDRRDGLHLLLKDGSRHLIDDGRPDKTWPERLADPDLEDMLSEPYPIGGQLVPPEYLSDPGRARNNAFLSRIYGNCSSGEVARQLVDVVWLPRKWGHRLKVTRVNGVSDRLAAVSRELDALPASFDPYLFPAAGTFNCRMIAGTSQPSAHGYGIAIDIALKHAHYWRWTRPTPNGRYPYRNSIPREIVDIFERHGFIWGGRWYHYDTMHFEYRPELLPAAASPAR